MPTFLQTARLGATFAILLAAVPAPAGEMSKTVDGLTISYGVTTSADLARSANHHDPAMHASRWRARGSHHLVVSIIDARSGQRLGQAKVRATVQPLGLAPERKTLQPMEVDGLMSYGNYFDLSPDKLPATITIEVERQRGHAASTASFQYGTPAQR